MHFYAVSVLPELFESFAKFGVFGRAVETGLLQLVPIAMRDHAANRYRSVDDYPYGGGDGMVIQPGPVVESLRAADAMAARAGISAPRKVLLGAHGKTFTQRDAERYAAFDALTLVCGRYEGIDERVREYVDEEISLGDYVLMGGEAAAMCIIEAVARLQPGVLGNATSTRDESHATGLLEYPQYTRPPIFEGLEVPSVLLSGNHKEVAEYRQHAAILRTQRLRPELIEEILAKRPESDALVQAIHHAAHSAKEKP